jgi:FemAB-related protein (PEP-CTERM system-associated)
MSALTIVSSKELSPTAWDRYVDAHPRATGYHVAAWRAPVERAFGHRWVSLVATEGGVIRGLLPLFQVRRGLLASQLITGPFGYYNGAIGDTAEIEGALYRHARELAHRLDASFLMIKTTHRHPALQGEEWMVQDHFSYSWLDLPRTADELWGSVRSEIRNRVRRAEKAGLVVRRGRAYLDGFYRVYCERMHELGSPAQPRRFFEEFFTSFGEHSELYTVWDGDHVIGGATYFSFHETGYAPWLGCLHSYFNRGIYQLLYWRILETIIGRMKVFDFGRSTLTADATSSTLTAKQRWGTQSAPIYHVYHIPSGKVSELPVDDWRATMFTETWKRLPPWVTEYLGRLFYRYFVAR